MTSAAVAALATSESSDITVQQALEEVRLPQHLGQHVALAPCRSWHGRLSQQHRLLGTRVPVSSLLGRWPAQAQRFPTS